MTIREASESDVDGIHDVAQASWETDYPDILSRETVEEGVKEWYDTDNLREAVRDSRTRLFVADEDEGVVGFVHGILSNEDEGHILRLYVHPDHRKQGLGRQLFERVHTDLTDHGVDQLYAMVLADNDLGEAFYQSLGFEKTGESETTIGGNAYRESTFVLKPMT
ncbi:GNAT family N-acetyltransferase [Halorientalis brevis]|uniref:GNAT family N-acetyltransferase n=1 Tax=Halorientalis brevis TaxID=1126241 RepID=A0ABD6CBU8_9EURY|nr:GNAT family N-acetyltransferase [Halorientalis brevis]